MKRKWLLLLAIAILLFPRKSEMDDGGSIAFISPVYSVIQYHMLDPENKGEYPEGWHVEILGVEIYHHLQ